jgi:hypothetical protein
MKSGMEAMLVKISGEINILQIIFGYLITLSSIQGLY